MDIPWPAEWLWLHKGTKFHKGHVVAQLGETLRYKPEGAGWIPDDVPGIFHRQSIWPHYDPGVDSAFKRNQ